MRVRIPVRSSFVVALAIAGLSATACYSGDSQGRTPAGIAPSVTATATTPARGTESVPTPVPTPTPDPAIWRNGTVRCPMPPHVNVPPNGAAQGDATKGFCIVWSNDFPDELGFRVQVRYGGRGETFSHTVGPDEHDFVFPPEEAPVHKGPQCDDRKDWTVTVYVVRPGGETPIGGGATASECRG